MGVATGFALLLSLTCLASFAWAIQVVFHRPGGALPARMRWLTATGTLFGLWQLYAIASAVPRFPLLTLAGTLLFVLSLGLFWWTVAVTRREKFAIAFSEGQPARLITTGPYRLVRHPYYLSYLLAWLAGVLCAQAVELGITVLVMWQFYRLAISDEEAGIMAGPLSFDYAVYSSKTPAIIPRIKL
jgi:protein-S-isoprenylcysteine O-methyltransferase Ste14